MTNSKRLYLIDGNSYIYRAFYAIKHLSTSNGLPTNAVFGFVNMLLKIINDEKPDYLAIAFDVKGPTFRHQQFEEYKANRPQMPDDLVPQIPYIKDLVDAFNIPIFQKEGYEADDILGTIAKNAESQGFEVTIITGDKDLFQLITPHIRVLDTLKNKVYQEKEVQEKFGVVPQKMVDIMGLMGDKIDNIPGVPGIGEKTATKLIREFGSMEYLLNNVDKVESNHIRNKIKEHIEQAQLSKKLATIKIDVEIDFNIDDFKITDLNQPKLIGLLKELEFNKLLKEIIPRKETQTKIYKTVLTNDDFQKLVNKLKSSTFFALDLETTHPEPMQAEIVGMSFSIKENEAYYIPMAHSYTNAPLQLDKKYVLQILKPILENENIKKYGQNIKYEIIVLSNNGIHLAGISFDTMVASYLLNPTKHNHNLDDIALEYLNYKTISYKEVAGTGSKKITFDKVDIEQATQYAAEDADVALQLTQILKPKLKDNNLDTLFYQIEIPLVEVLAQVEKNGVKIDVELLKDMSKELDIQLEKIISRIYLLAGEEFNINSPKQLSEILFNKLKLPTMKRTKTGHSTNVEVLQRLALKHELPAEVLNYRQLTKLKSTYVDTLPNLINHKTGRVHTSYNQTVTATGRLSSSNPNLQNIPIRTEFGQRIRSAFIPEAEYLILSADYSQIELRILSHLSQDEVLLNAFINNEDVHTRTAVEIFGVFPSMVTSEMRRMAKVVNFGIIYGMSPYGLAKELGVNQREAKHYIDSYFHRYQGVKTYINQTIEEAHKNGYVTTLFQRRRYLPELKSRNRAVREFGERTAINTPIQGTAADLIKLAMLNIQKELDEKKLSSKMILQIHDELVFEVPKAEAELMKNLVKRNMEGVMDLEVPIKVDMNIGQNWSEAH